MTPMASQQRIFCFSLLIASFLVTIIPSKSSETRAFEKKDSAEAVSQLDSKHKPSLPKTVEKLKAGTEPVNVICFGDSVTGLYYHTGGRRTYTDMLGIAIHRVYPNAKATLINAGISGNTTVNALGRIERDVLKKNPTLVTVMFGLNDMVRVPLADYRKNLITIVEKCRSDGAEVLLCTPNSVTDTASRPTKKLIEYCNVVRDIADEYKVPLCDTYRACETVRRRDALSWRLLMSDAIHPNMAGHKLIAREIAYAISGKRITLDNVPSPAPGIPRTLSLLGTGKPVTILAMPPYDKLIAGSLKKLSPSAQLKIHSWPTAGQSVTQLEQSAKSLVRTMKPDLVIIAVPRFKDGKPTESFIHSYAWTMNWSLSFGKQQWDCIAIHPSVADSKKSEPAQDDLVRTLIKAQDLSLIDRKPNDASSAAEVLEAWLKNQGM